MAKFISLDLKKLIIQKSQMGMRNSAIARDLQLNRKSVSRIIINYQKDGKVVRQRSHQPKKLTSIHQDKLREWLDEDCQLSLKDLVAKLKSEFDLDISTATVHRCLGNELFFSLKKLSVVPS